ncbi:TolC family protein [Polynucleobacter necessarius]|uniref:TolC family protein n=1 Tax=Polynucleobacter necessarius TaxID=576610 RepID=UPI000E08DF17|nr:TolC family protein [Polynucleobacter necessarius]
MSDAFRALLNSNCHALKELWRQDFESEELDGLIDAALTNNYDLRVAVARVAQTRAQADVVKANESPTIDVGGSLPQSSSCPRPWICI